MPSPRQIERVGPAGRRPPSSVLLAGAVANICQLAELLARPFHPVSLVGLGLTVLSGLLLVIGSTFGWLLMMIWAASVISAPFVFDAAFWPALAGAVVALVLTTQGARRYCLGRPPASAVSIHPIAAERKLVAGIPAALFKLEEALAPSQIRRSVEGRVPRSWLRRRNVFLFFLGATFVLLPLSGVVGRLDRNSGHNDLLVDIVYHAVSVCSTLALVGLIVTLFLMLRAAVR